MHTPESFRASFVSTLEARGIPSWELPSYRQFLDELAEFMGAYEPAAWEIVDLERFFASRVASLTASQRSLYGTALGILSEVLDEYKSRPRQDESGFERVSTGPSMVNLDDTAAAFDADALRPEPRSRVAASDDDFLAENLQRWDQRRSATTPAPASRRRGSTVESGVDLRPERPKVCVRASSGDEASRRTKPSIQPSAGIDVSFHAETRTVRLEWRGFVVGDDVHDAVEGGLALQARHKCPCWLLNLRIARVMSLSDSVWFEDWLVNAGINGVRRIAVLNPEHIITRMQLQRLSGAADASTAGFARENRVELGFFDDTEQAVDWLWRR